MSSGRDDVLDYLTASRDGDEESVATRLRPRLLSMDPGVVLTILRALPSAIASAGVRDPYSEALVESARDMADNARDLAEAFGDRARDRLVEGHYDSSPIVRAGLHQAGSAARAVHPVDILDASYGRLHDH